MIRRMITLIAIGCIANAMTARAASPDDNGFGTCLASLQARARSEHLPTWIIDDVLPGLEQQPRVIELDRKQPEFTQTFWR